jgi:MHS family proline/betaine transporter-like MFS transporter
MILKRIKILYASLGSALEYYDFVVYGMMADIINRLFFQGQILDNYFVFAFGYLCRPIGGILFGFVSDRYSRVRALSLSIFLMALATIGIGLCTPCANGWKIIFFLRMLQGISFGGEFPNAMLFSLESQTKNQNAYVVSSAALGSIIASFSVYLLTKFFDTESINSYAWRLPFLFGGVMALVCYKMRISFAKNFDEQVKNNRMCPKEIFYNLFKNLPSVFFSVILLFLPLSLIIMNLHLPSIMSGYYDFDRSTLHSISMFAIAIMMFCNPFMARFFIEKIKYLSIVNPIATLMLYACYQNGFMFVFFIILQMMISLNLIFVPQIVLGAFQKQFRGLGLGITYNVAVICASFMPMWYNGMKTLCDVSDRLIFGIGCFLILWVITFVYMMSRSVNEMYTS